MPTLHHLYDDKVGVVHAYRHEGKADKVGYFLTVYNWNHDAVVRKSSIKLFDIDFDDSLHFISTLNFNVESDTVFVVFTHMFDMQARLVEFKLTHLTEVSAGTPMGKAQVDSSVKCTLYEKMITTLVTLHRHTDGTLFLLC